MFELFPPSEDFLTAWNSASKSTYGRDLTIVKLCQITGHLDLATEFIANGRSVDEAGLLILEARATKDNEIVINSTLSPAAMLDSPEDQRLESDGGAGEQPEVSTK